VVRAVSDLGLNHIPCFAHKLNLCANSSISSSQALKKAKETIANLVKATRRSSNIKRSFELCQTRFVFALLFWFHQSSYTNIHNKYYALRLSSTTPKKLILDVATRWNSSFLMLQRAYELREAITLFQVMLHFIY